MKARHLGAGILAAAMGLAPASAWSKEQYLEMRFERTPQRAMGGVDIAINPSTPANGALGGGLKLTVVGLDVYATLSEGIRAYRLGRDVWETGLSADIETREGLEQLADDVQRFGRELKGNTLSLELQSRIDLLQALINRGNWTIQIGAYSETMMGARAVIPSRIVLRDFETDSPYIDFGSRTTLFRVGARTDLGAAFGFGVAIPVSENFRVSLGARARGFYRVSLPEHIAVVNAEVRGPEDVQIPTSFQRQQGWGVGLDLYSVLHFSPTLTGFRLGAYLEDAVTYVDRGDKTFMVPARLGIGMAWVSLDGRLTLGADVERIETLSPTLQLGASYRIGVKQAYFTPKFGVIVNYRDIAGTDLRPTISTGVDITLGPMFIGTAMEYQTATKAFNAGLSLAFGF